MLWAMNQHWDKSLLPSQTTFKLLFQWHCSNYIGLSCLQPCRSHMNSTIYRRCSWRNQSSFSSVGDTKKTYVFFLFKKKFPMVIQVECVTPHTSFCTLTFCWSLRFIFWILVFPSFLCVCVTQQVIKLQLAESQHVGALWMYEGKGKR